MAALSPASARSGRRSSASTGRGAPRHAPATANPARAARALCPASTSAGTVGPSTRCPAPNPGSRRVAISGKVSSARFSSPAGVSARPITSTRRDPCTPISTSTPILRAIRRSWSTSNCGGVVPTSTATSPWPCQPSAAIRLGSSSSASPVRIESTTRASSRASQRPRASAARAYTSAEANATSRENSRMLSRRSSPRPATRSSVTSTVTRMSCSVCVRLTLRSSSRGAAAKMSAAIHGVEPGSSYH